MRCFAWYCRQLFPLTYRSHYGDEFGAKYFAVWRMQFGRVFDYEVFKLGE